MNCLTILIFCLFSLNTFRGNANFAFHFSDIIDLEKKYIHLNQNELKQKYVKNYDSLVFTHIMKEFHMEKNHVRVLIKGEIKNVSSTSVGAFTFFLPYHEAYQMSSFQIKDHEAKSLNYQIFNSVKDINEIRVDSFQQQWNINDFKTQVIEILLHENLKKEETKNIKISYFLHHAYIPFPSEVSSIDHQNVLFYFTSAILLGYPAETLQVLINMCDDCMIVQMKDAEFMKEFRQINVNTYLYEIKDRVRSFSLGNKVFFYFTLVSPLGYFEKVHKEVYISQLGMIYEKEEYFLINNASRIRHFDRYMLSNMERKYNDMEEKNIKEKEEKEEDKIKRDLIKTTVIYGVRSEIDYDIYEFNFYDNLGKIYLVNRKKIYDKERKKTSFVFELKPRYPLLGSWNAHFFNSFHHYHNLFKVKNNHYFAYKIDIAPSIKSFFIKNLQITIILPLYSKNIAMNKKFPLEIQMENRKEWLDIKSSRKVIHLTLRNFFPYEDSNKYQNYYVTYYLPWGSFLLRPIYIILIFFILFLIIFLFFWTKRSSFKFDTCKEKLIHEEKEERNEFVTHGKELYEQLLLISEKLFGSIKENIHYSGNVIHDMKHLEENWTFDFIYYVNKFQKQMKHMVNRKLKQNFIDQCNNYHVAVKNTYNRILKNKPYDLNEIKDAERNILQLLYYN